MERDDGSWVIAGRRRRALHEDAKMTESAIHVTGLTKTFGHVTALDAFDLEVSVGEVHGFLGPNGAGKSTLIRVLLGLLRKDHGEAVVLGGDPWRDAVELHARLAYVPGDVHLWPNLTGGEAIDLLGELRGRLDTRRRDDLVDRFRLDPTKRCGTYSKGNRQKVALVAAFASEVELYLLDEPTSGLDPLMDSIFRSCVAEATRHGATVLLSSHVLAEVEALADRLTIIREGRAVRSGTLADLRHLTRTSITVTTARPVTGLERLEGVHDLEVEGTEVRMEVEPVAMPTVQRLLAGHDVLSMISSPPTLQQLFLRHYGQESTPTEHVGIGR
jgi:ABC-2 type transport system ATP-binding protein